MKLTQYTLFRDEESFIDSQWGTLTYIQWLEKEKERIERNRDRTAEIRREGINVALFVDDV